MNEIRPFIRFSKFNKKWKRCNLGSLCEVIDTKHATAPIVNFKTPYRMIRTSTVREGRLFPNKMDYVTYDTYEKWSERIHLEKNDVVFSREAPMGEVAIIPKDKNKYFLGQRMVGMRVFDELESSFLLATFLAPKFRKEIKIRNSGSTTVANFGIFSIKNYEIDIAEKEEQIKIGSFFNSLNDVLILQQQLLNDHKQLKKAMLQKMFPQKGESVPRVRFTGFTDCWKDYELSRVAEITSGGTPKTDNPKYWNGSIDWYSPTEIGKKSFVDGSKKKITEEGLNKSSAKILPAHKTILFTSRAGIGDMAILRKEAATNQGFQSFVMKDNFHVYFTYSMREKIKKYALKHSAGSTFLEISGKTLGKIKIKYPLFKEQEKIGNYFKKLDEIIALHEQKLETYQELKKAMLQKMFV